ncbi:MAG: hemolysin family protein [Oligoflexus sp.]
MDPGILAGELFVILILVILNGLLAMSEMAMVSARKIRLQQAAQTGSKGAKSALKLLEQPSQFLAAIQIGITLIGVFAGAFGGANLAKELEGLVVEVPFLAPYASSISLGAVVLLVTLLSLIIGELVPKRLALGNPESIAALMSKPITWLSFFSRPAVRFLSAATEGILKLLQYKQPKEAPVTDDEVKILVEQGTQAGVFEPEEEKIIKRTLRLSDRSVGEVMTLRLHLTFLNIDDPLEVNLEKIRSSFHSYFPVCQGEIDNVIGVVSVKKLFAAMSSGQSLDLKANLQETLFVAEQMPPLKLLEFFKNSQKHFAVVVDEYGGISGIITAIDLLESIAGDLPEEHDNPAEEVVLRDDGTWLVDGISDLDNVAEVIGVSEDEFFTEDAQTIGGFIMGIVGHIPHTGEKIYWKSWSFEIVDMDRNRVDKVLITPPKVVSVANLEE